MESRATGGAIGPKLSLRELLGRGCPRLAGAERRWWIWELVPGVLVLLLVATVAVAAIVLLREGERRTTAGLPVSLATLYRVTGDEREAIGLLDVAVESAIHDLGALAQIGQACYAVKEPAKALDVLEQVVAKNARDRQAHLTLARSHGRTGQRQEAIAGAFRVGSEILSAGHREE